jgi:glycosyltransferase involved in cell wall biosynthesis
MNQAITVLAFSFNEQKRIGFFLDALKDLGPIVVVDNFSTDRTAEIATQRGGTVVQYRNGGYAEEAGTMKFALAQVHSEWVYWGRVDEIPPAPLLRKLDEIARTDACDIVLVARWNFLFGAPVRTWGDDRQTIFFKKEAINPARSALFEHAAPVPGARLLRLPADAGHSLWHFSSYDVAAYTNTNNRYSSIAAAEIARRRDHPGIYSTSTEVTKRVLKTAIGKIQGMPGLAILRLFVFPPLRFVWHYFWRGGIRSGRSGLVTSYLMMMEQMLIELKVDERARGISLAALDEQYDRLKLRLVAGEVPPISR